jgi:hypothetical protein
MYSKEYTFRPSSQIELHPSLLFPGRMKKLRKICSSLEPNPLSLMMEAACTYETLVDNYFTRQYIPEDNSELHTRRRENLKSHVYYRVENSAPLVTILSQIKLCHFL